MTTKMKGLLKGLRYISQIFDEEKEDDIQIGFPTDVKHVAHIGWDAGPTSVNDSPSWMEDFKPPSTTELQSAPLGAPLPGSNNNGPSKSDKNNDPHVKWVSEDSKRSSRRDKDELPKSSRRHSMNTNNNINNNNNNNNNNNDDDESSLSPKKKDSKPRQSRRHQAKVQESQDSTNTTSADVPIRKSRRKKSKEEGGSTRGSRSKPANGNDASLGYSDHGSDPAPVLLKPTDDYDDYPRQSRVTFKDC